MHPIFTTVEAFLIISSVKSFDFCLLISIPTSFITCSANGLISETGLVPALKAAYPLGAYLLKKPSAIWLRPAFSTQTNRTILSNSCSLVLDLPNENFICCLPSFSPPLSLLLYHLLFFDCIDNQTINLSTINL